jgi:hypothetical protein
MFQNTVTYILYRKNELTPSSRDYLTYKNTARADTENTNTAINGNGEGKQWRE